MREGGRGGQTDKQKRARGVWKIPEQRAINTGHGAVFRGRRREERKVEIQLVWGLATMDEVRRALKCLVVTCE